MANILAINGPNLNLLGSREPHLYGSETLSSLNSRLTGFSAGLGHTFTAMQSNHEGELIDCIQASALDGTHFIILNPGGLSHTSVVLRDALLGVALPFIEVHLSNIHQREAFRQHSYFADIAIGTITGLGAEGYFSALRYAHSYLTSPNNQTIRS